MSNFNNGTIVICEPTVSYSSSVNFSIGNTLGYQNNKSNKSSFTPLWKKKLPKKKNKLSKTNASHSAEKLSQLLIQNATDNYNNQIKLKRSKSFSDDDLNSSLEKSSDINTNNLEHNYDELIEKLKRSPPQLKPSYTQESYYNNFNLDDSERNIKIKQKNTKDDFSIAQKRFSSPLIFNNSFFHLF